MQQYYKDLACNFVAKCIISLYPCVFCFNLILNNFLNHKRWNLVSVLKVSQWDFQNLNMWCFNKKYLRNIFPQAIEDEGISFGTKDVMADKQTLTYERMKKEGGLKKEKKTIFISSIWRLRVKSCRRNLLCTWSHIDLMIRCSAVVEDWQSLRKCSRTVKNYTYIVSGFSISV